MAKRFPLGGKVAIVTGSARGIGLATAAELSTRGASVVVVDLEEGAAEAAAAVAAPASPSSTTSATLAEAVPPPALGDNPSAARAPIDRVGDMGEGVRSHCAPP